MSEKVYTVYRQLRTYDGCQLSLPLATYAREEDAQKASKAMMDAFRELAEGVIVVNDKAVTVVGNLISQLGLAQVGYAYTATDVKGALVLEARPPLVLVQ